MDKENTKIFHCDNECACVLPKNHCAFCKHCTEIYYDSDGPYLFYCEEGYGDYETCNSFLEEG